ncbi:MAG TPA: N-acetyltransferase [Rhodobacteraceae bacterium]|nr:N-acetyltransferase [Paracoccaceae bacterium]
MMDNYSIRHFCESDFEDFHASMCEYDVVKMTGSWPWPPDPAFTRNRMVTPQAKDGHVSVIDFEGAYIGQVSVVDGVLGYMLAKPHWGRGIASWAVGMKLTSAFAEQGLGEVTACVWLGNPASEAVLFKYGFVKTGTCEAFCIPRGETVKNNTFRLTRAAWEAQNA